MAWWATYTSSDVSVIGDYIEIDEVLLEDSDGLLHELRREAPEYVYAMLHQTAVTGRPICYAYTEQSFVLYPVPDGTYTINPMGLLRKAAPTDDTAGNVWMTEAFELIRCHAKLLLAVHTIRDQASGELMANAAAGAKAKLERETSSRSAVGRMVATAF